MQTQITKPYQLTAASRAISINAANNKYWSDCGEMCTLDVKGDVVSATNENTKKVLWKGKNGATSQSITTTEPARMEPVLRNKRGRDSERPTPRDEEWPPLAAPTESPRAQTKIQHSQK